MNGKKEFSAILESDVEENLASTHAASVKMVATPSFGSMKA